MANTEFIQTRVPPRLYRRLRKEATNRGVSMAALVRGCLSENVGRMSLADRVDRIECFLAERYKKFADELAKDR